MKIKKLVKWVLPAFLGIVPTFGAEQPAGIIDDAFFTKDGTARSISRVVAAGPKLMAQVTATDAAETRNKLVEALCETVGWQNNDQEHYAQEIVKAQVICGPDLLEFNHTKALQVPYEIVERRESRFLADVPLKAEDKLPIGAFVEVWNVIKYKRPNTTTFEEKVERLYNLILQQETKALGQYVSCVRHDYRDGPRKDHRHDMQAYDGTEVKTITYRFTLDGNRVNEGETVQQELTRINVLLTNRPDHNIKADLPTAIFLESLAGWVVK